MTRHGRPLEGARTTAVGDEGQLPGITTRERRPLSTGYPTGGDNTRDTPRFAWEPLGRLLVAAGADTVLAQARRLGVNARQVYRWRDYGLDAAQCDAAATRLGLHVLNVWPTFHDAAHARDQREREIKAARRREYLAAWRAANRERTRRYARDYYRQHRERLIPIEVERKRRRRQAMAS